MKVFSHHNKNSQGFTIVELLIVIVVIATIAVTSVVAYRGVTSRAKSAVIDADISQWKKQADAHKIRNRISCPDNYVFVYGNPSLGTNDFCVMKYEAKIKGNDTGSTTYSSSMSAESRPSGTPWVNINQSQALIKSSEAGGHLITEPEWMTIAADVLSIKHNWSGGEVGSGYIYQGHVNNNPASALSAHQNDAEGLTGITGGTGTSVGTNSRRTLYLSSGDVIWDFSGNTYEWTQQQVNIPTLTLSQVGVPGDSATTFTWRDYTLSTLSLGNLAAPSRPSTLSSTPALSSISSWGSAQGLGSVYTRHTDTAARAFQRGGSWGALSNGGPLSLALSAAPAVISSNLGFRVAR